MHQHLGHIQQPDNPPTIDHGQVAKMAAEHEVHGIVDACRGGNVRGRGRHDCGDGRAWFETGGDAAECQVFVGDDPTEFESSIRVRDQNRVDLTS